MSTINDRLAALASLVKEACPQATVYAPDKTPSQTDTYPIMQCYPYREQLEETETGLWGNVLPHEQPGAHGPDHYCVAVLQAPLAAGLDEQGAKRALNDHVDAIRAQLLAQPGWPDTNANATVLDGAGHIQVNWQSEGEWLVWHQRDYVGAMIIIDVNKQRQGAGG